MGNYCTCLNCSSGKNTINNTIDLSFRNNFIHTKNTKSKCFSSIKNSRNKIQSLLNSGGFNISTFNNSVFSRFTQYDNISIITKNIRGYLFRKKYNSSIKDELILYKDNFVSYIISKYCIIKQIKGDLRIKYKYEIDHKMNSNYEVLINDAIEVYYGEMNLGTKEGIGILIDKVNNTIFEGNFSENIKIKGTLQMKSNGDIYEGEFNSNGLFSGNGHYKWKDSGDEYIGKYKEGKFDCFGLYKWNTGEYYKGEYKDGLKNGKGEILLSNGALFIGMFQNGQMHGKGWYSKKNIIDGMVEFENGQLVINKNI